MEKKKRIPRRLRCYNSGKIGRLSYLAVLKKFHEADCRIADEMKLHPVSPLDNGLRYSRPWWMHIAVDILMLATCGNIYLQADWRDSRGARIEYRVARFLGLNIWEEVNDGLEK